MQFVRAFLLVGAIAFSSTAASAADQLKFGPRAAWVVPQAIPPAAASAAEQPVAILVHDQQSLLEPGKISTYSEIAFKIQKAEGLSAGNLSVQWNPASDTVTVHRVGILRGGQSIDVLKNGQTFTTLRRESNLELATLDGVLTATIQPEGLQEGDTVIFATTIEHSDPVLKGHVEASFASWSTAQIGLAHARLSWPSTLDLKIKRSGDLAAPKEGTSAGRKTFDLTMRDVQPLIPPRSAPVRYAIGRLGEATDFRSWAEAAALMAPLYREAAVVPPTGALRDELEKIRNASADPKVRAGLALQLVQQRVRYVALLMGQGGLVPAPAEATWSRRFGDCKAKTALLLGLLHELGIESEPVLVNSTLGDAIGERLPMVSLFDHVLVRAHVVGATYWLDGTRTGEARLDNLEAPNFGWGLPLVADAALVRITPAIARKPQSERTVTIDASAGVYAPAKVEIDQLVRGSNAVALNALMAKLAANQRDEVLKAMVKGYVDWMDVTSATTKVDPETAEFRILASGTGKLEWRDGWFTVPSSSIAYDPNFERAPGPAQQAPFVTDFPAFETSHVVVRLPTGFLASQPKFPGPLHETLAGVEFVRTSKMSGDTLTVDTSERTVVPELSYQEAKAAEARLKALWNDDVYLHLTGNYRPTATDLAALQAVKPSTADEYLRRGWAFYLQHNFASALPDLDEGLKLNPKNVQALLMRSTIYVELRRLDDAAKDITAAQLLEPQNAEVLVNKAHLADMREDNAGAEAAYAEALKIDPGNQMAHLERARLINNRGDFAGAVAEIDALLARDPKNVAALLQRAFFNANRRDMAAAERDLAAAKTIEPNSPLVAQTASMVAMAGSNFDQAIALQTKLIQQYPKDGTRYLTRAQYYYRAGKSDLALKDTEQALAHGTRSPEVRLLRANLFKRKGDKAAVAREAALIESENPDSAYAHVVAAKSLASIDKIEEAMKAFDRALAIKAEAYIYLNREQIRPKADVAARLADLDAALKLDPNDSNTLVEKAKVLIDEKQFAAASELFERAKVDPTDMYLQTQRAVVMLKSGRTAEGEALFKDLHAKARASTDMNNLCWAKATNDVMLDVAVEECREAVKLDPANGAAQDSLGMALLKLGKLDEALAAYTRAIDDNRTGASPLMGRAIVYARKGDRAHAAADAAAARKESPRIEETYAGYGLKL